MKAQTDKPKGENSWQGLFVNRNCKHFQDYKPCKPHKKYGVLCKDCPYYERIKTKILLINLEAIGDVLRTTSLLVPLRDKYPHAQITWVTTQKCIDVLKNNPYVDRIMPMSYETSLQLMIEEFDVAINLEKAHEACALLTLVKAREKYGLELDKDGSIRPLNEGAKYFFDIGISDKHKRMSRKTQQEIIFDMVGIKYQGQRSILILEDHAKKYADEFFAKNGISSTDLVIGLNTGCSNRLFLDRKWTVSGFLELARLLHSVYNAKVLLLGGPNEVARNKEIMEKADVPVVNTGNSNTFHQFSAIISKCSLIVTADTMAVHIAAALRIPVVVFFGNLMPYEIELYGKGKWILTDMECAGCYKFKCEFKKTCMDRLQATTVFSAVEEVLIKEQLIGQRPKSISDANTMVLKSKRGDIDEGSLQQSQQS